MQRRASRLLCEFFGNEDIEMNTKNLHRLIADEKSKLTDSELFGSPAYRSYLQSIADNLSGKYGRGGCSIHRQLQDLHQHCQQAI